MAKKLKPTKSLSKIHQDILQLLRKNVAGLTIYDIRERLPGIEIQQHLDKRVRELRKFYDVPLERRDGKAYYVYKGERKKPAVDSGHIKAPLRAQLLHEANGRCQMCGRTVKEDKIKFEIDHKIPRNWGGPSSHDNLWAICQLCNGGKRDFFSSFSDSLMRKLLSHDSVYERILETLRLDKDSPTPSWLLAFVANFDDWQDDWQKRLRELRYPVIGIKIKSSRKKNPQGKWEAAYLLEKDKPLPKDHKFLIKDYERKNRKKNLSA